MTYQVAIAAHRQHTFAFRVRAQECVDRRIHATYLFARGTHPALRTGSLSAEGGMYEKILGRCPWFRYRCILCHVGYSNSN
mmetsp:Transcript_10996/g.15644  ORF Transcript_10996/g.15644 Transcript_10996/m.15644 type:complete len:81 (-) Transcript_10996:31-273(-)